MAVARAMGLAAWLLGAASASERGVGERLLEERTLRVAVGAGVLAVIVFTR